MTGRRLAGLLAMAVLALGGLSLFLGQDLNFDLLNYHYYDGYAFLHDRIDRDIVPAGQQSFLVPLIHVFHYLGIAHLPPRLFGFLLGALHGLNLPLVFALGLTVLRRDDSRTRSLLALLAAVVGSLGPAAISLLGTTFGDNLVSIPALAAIILVLRDDETHPHLAPSTAALAAGALAGCATGLKLTMAAPHVALVVAAAVAWARRPRPQRRLALLITGSATGFLATSGFWYWRLAQRFGNPVFPFANSLFHSPYHSPEGFRDARWMAHTPYDLVRPLIDTALGRPQRFTEIGMRDLRFMLVLLAALLGLVVWIRSLVRRHPLPPARRLETREVAFAAYWLTAYLVWAVTYYYYRYIALLEFTAPLLLFVLLRPLVPATKRLHAAAALALAIVLTTHTDSWGRRPWHSPWLALPVPPLGRQPDSLVLMVGQPSAFAVPSFRADARFVNLTAVDRFQAPAAWDPLVRRAVATQRGPILLLSNFEFSRADCDRRAARLGLRPTPRCEAIRNGSLRFRLCELERMSPDDVRE
jgi:hypothetical protein